MNVKQGDLAIQIKSLNGNDGAIVKIIQYLGVHPEYMGYLWHKNRGGCWLVEYQKMGKAKGGLVNKFLPTPDSWLRPVSGLPLQEDEHIDIKEPA